MVRLQKNQMEHVFFHLQTLATAPIVIKRIQSTCGCTVPEKPEAPIIPGAKGTIKSFLMIQKSLEGLTNKSLSSPMRNKLEK